MADIVKQDFIEKKIYLVRGLNVMLNREGKWVKIRVNLGWQNCEGTGKNA